MARRFFEPESLVWKPFGYLGELVMMSLLWGLCAIPLVTIGPASAALYDCAVHCLRRKEGDLFSRFFRTFKVELKTGLLSTLLWMLLLALPLALHYGAVGSLGSVVFNALEVLSLLLLFFLTVILCWVFPTLSRFTFGFASLNRTAVRLALAPGAPALAVRPLARRPLNAQGVLSLLLLFFLAAVLCWVFPTLSRFTFGFASLNRTAVRLALGNILRSVALVLLNGVSVLLVLLFAAPVLFAPGLAALLSSFLIEPVFRKYET